jgi:hypothetical protein
MLFTPFEFRRSCELLPGTRHALVKSMDVL